MYIITTFYTFTFTSICLKADSKYSILVDKIGQHNPKFQMKLTATVLFTVKYVFLKIGQFSTSLISAKKTYNYTKTTVQNLNWMYSV